MTVFLFQSSAIALGEKAKPRSAKPNTVGAAFKNFIRSPFWCSKLSEPVPSLRMLGLAHAGVRCERALQSTGKSGQRRAYRYAHHVIATERLKGWTIRR